MKHSSEPKGDGFTILSKIASCEETTYLEMYYADEGSALEYGTRCWFEALSETVFGELVLPKDSNWNL